MKKEDKGFSFHGKYLFVIVLFLYGLLCLLNIQSALSALQKSSAILTKLLPIFVLVILFMALLNFFVKPRQIAKHLGRDSGIRGWIWALASGVVSHGPMYAWYPLLKDLRSHGMRDALIVVFFASRAIKVPLLPVMIDYFGLVFTLLLSLFILLGALFQGVCMQFLHADKTMDRI